MNKEDIITTDHEECAELVEVLAEQGVRNVVISPGSRNAPLIVAFARERRMAKHVIVDERSAAFAAVGMAQCTGEPVAVVCTSGSAVLNYAPAVSEAFYRHLPLIIVSADRQAEWIDQNDSQTIRQPGVLAGVVKHSCNIPWNTLNPSLAWWANRMVNEAAIIAKRAPRGPVHINVQLCEPLCGTHLRPGGLARIIENVEAARHAPCDIVDECARAIAVAKRVMIVVGVMPGQDSGLCRVLENFSLLDNVVVLTETISNIGGGRIITTIDCTLSAIPAGKEPLFAPHLLITMGGALVTRMLKSFLRGNPALEEWRIGIDHNVIDTMQHLTKRFEMEPQAFLGQLWAAMELREDRTAKGDYASLWRDAASRAEAAHKAFIAAAPWCDLKAFSTLLPMIPKGADLHLSNGTAIRYAQLFTTPQVHRSYCNRGVAGIDGSTSTALGSSLVTTDRLTLLITGDMSLLYDISGLASLHNSPRFKIVVMCNGGGGIFRFIKGPSELEELEQYFEVSRDLPVDRYAQAFGFGYHHADSEVELEAAMERFLSDPGAAILAIHTTRTLNAEVLRGYFAAIREKSCEK